MSRSLKIILRYAGYMGSRIVQRCSSTSITTIEYKVNAFVKIEEDTGSTTATELAKRNPLEFHNKPT